MGASVGERGWVRLGFAALLMAGLLVPTSAVVASSGNEVAVGDASVLEGDSGSDRVLKFPVTLSDPSMSVVTVDYTIADVSASAPDDFDDRGGALRTLTFKVGGSGLTAVRKWVSVKVHPDAGVEGDETLTVTLSGPTGGYILGRSVGTGTILDDDPTGGLEVGVADAGIVEGDTGKARKVAFAVTLSAPSGSSVTVDYTIAGVSASAPDDFDDRGGAPRTLSIAPGKVAKYVAVVVNADTTDTIDETFTIMLSNPTGAATISRTVGAGTILDDDAPLAPLSVIDDPSEARLAEGIPTPTGGVELRDEIWITVDPPGAPGNRARASEIAASVTATIVGGFDSFGIYQLRFDAPVDVASVIARVNQLPDATAQPSAWGDVGAHADPPGDWSGKGVETTWPFDQIRARDAWDLTTGSDVAVGILDKGTVSRSHPDLDVRVPPGAPVASAASHATHVAGLACATANGFGLVGAAWGCPVTSVGISAYRDSDYQVFLAAEDLLEDGASVINISLGYALGCTTQSNADQVYAYGLATYGNLFRNLFASSFGLQAVWTLSAGNDCVRGAGSPWAQVADEFDHAISVAATNSDRTLASFSNWGPGVEVAAPGGVLVPPVGDGTGGVWSTSCSTVWPFGDTCVLGTDGYEDKTGTSMAAPLVAGVAALVRSAHPEFSSEHVGACIVGSTPRIVPTRSAYPLDHSPDASVGPPTSADAIPMVDALRAVECGPGVSSGSAELGRMYLTDEPASGRWVAGLDTKLGTNGIIVYDANAPARPIAEFSTAAQGNIATGESQVTLSRDTAYISAVIGGRIRAYTWYGRLVWSSQYFGSDPVRPIPFGDHMIAVSASEDLLVPGATPGPRGIYLIDPSDGAVTQVLLGTENIDIASLRPSDGRYILVQGSGSAGDTTLCSQCLYRLDTSTGALILVGARDPGTSTWMSAGGGRVVFRSLGVDRLWSAIDGTTSPVNWGYRQLSPDLSFSIRAEYTTCTGSCPYEIPVRLYWSAFPSGPESLIYDGYSTNASVVAPPIAIDDSGSYRVFVRRYNGTSSWTHVILVQ